jgi:hypothetical protein
MSRLGSLAGDDPPLPAMQSTENVLGKTISRLHHHSINFLEKTSLVVAGELGQSAGLPNIGLDASWVDTNSVHASPI